MQKSVLFQFNSFSFLLDLKEQYGSLEDLDISTDGVDIPLFLNSLGTLAFIRSFTVISKLLLTVSLILVLLC